MLNRPFGGLDQALSRLGRERELGGEKALDGRALCHIEHAVHPRRLDQQRRHGELQIVRGVRQIRHLAAAQHIQHTFQHDLSQTVAPQQAAGGVSTALDCVASATSP